MVAVASVDLDNFKRVNDSLGTLLGDEFLKVTARRLQGLVQYNDTVARLASGEFILLEITEGSIMHDIEHAITIMSDFKLLGVTLSIDDFGTGYSNLNYLRRFPVDRLKIDQSFVRDVETTASAAAVVRSVIVLGHSLHLRVIAEGVETVGQAVFLRQNGCDEILSYLIARPQPAEGVQALISRPLPLPWAS